MTTSTVVVCTRNQAQRLRLVLRGLSNQTRAPDEIVVVDDASNDGTPDLLGEASTWFAPGTLRVVRNAHARGAAGARNAGAAAARGELLLFLDGDALPPPEHVASHLAFRQEHGDVVGIGPLWHTTTTEMLRDPIRGELFDDPAADAQRDAIERDLARMLVTEDDVLRRFRSIVERSAPGPYPSVAFMELEGRRIGLGEGHQALWVLMTPQNVAIPRIAFERAGGFDETLPFSEGWDLMLRLRAAGCRLLRVAAAPIYHLYHYRPLGSLEQQQWRWDALQRIARKTQDPTVLFCWIYFCARAGDRMIPAEIAPRDLDHVAELMNRYRPARDLGPYELVLRGHPRWMELAEPPG